MGVQGAATASVIARCAVLGVAFYSLARHHQFLSKPERKLFAEHFKLVAVIAVPAILTNVATPVGNAFITSYIAHFGDNFVAGYAVIGRLMPVAFALIFSLSGAIGPIIGQNFGAEKWDRVSGALRDAMIFCALYCVGVSVILYLGQGLLISAFSLHGESAHLLAVFCSFIAITFMFNGALFVANAAFNNLNRPTWSTALNVGKATIGTIPFAYVGGLLGALWAC
ncbi:MATE family efflux transporter [Dongshaea marina]